MKTNITLLAVTLTAAVAAHAQTAATGASSSSSSGLLGQRYAELGVGAVDLHGTSDLAFTSDLSVNLPLQPGLDLGFGYGYSRPKLELFDGLFTQRERTHATYVSATAYSEYRGVKPFFGASLGYRWSRSRLDFGGTRVLDDSDDEALWSLTAGVEIPVGRVTLTPSVSYRDGFDDDRITVNPAGNTVGSVSTHDQKAAFAYGIEANTWFTRTLGGFVDVAYSDPTGGGTQSWTYKVGARLRF